MSTMQDGIALDALLAEGAWLRRLAAVLVSDSDEAEDLTQDTWLVALRARPRTAAAARVWLRHVLLSRLHDARRARRRRAVREQSAMDDAASPEDPEALAARMELHQRVAGHMAALEEPIRQVLFLRFVEGLEPVEVARRLGIPGGTARWRLKRGLDELRARLDADFEGERRRWLPLLLPLLPRGSSVGSAGSARAGNSLARTQPQPWRSGIAAKLAVSGLVLAFGAFGASRACTGANPREAKVAASVVDGPLDLDAAARRVSEPVQAPPAAPAAALARPRGCPEAEALEKERDALAAAADPFWNPQVLFQRSPPNPETERRLRPLVDEAFRNAGHCGHTFECRGLACRVEVVFPESTAKGSAGMSTCVDLAPKIQFSERVTMMMKGDEGSTFDPLSRTWLRRETYYLRLAHESGEPIPRERRTAPRELPAGWNRERGPLPPDLAPECEAWAVRVRREIEALVRQMERGLPPRRVFASSATNPELSRQSADWVRPCLAPAGQDLPVDVECRGSTCALSPSSANASATRWRCPPGAIPRGLCFGDDEGDGWYARLLRCRDLQKVMEIVEGPTRLPSGWELASALVRVRPPEEREGVPGKLVLLRFAREGGFPSMVEECERLHPARGILLISARVPDRCGSANDAGRPRIGVELGGELFGTELAACLVERTKAALDNTELPRCVYGWRGEFRLEFPHPKIEIAEAEKEQ